MKIINLTENSDIYTSNAYLLLGAWNALSDVNTLIDTGRDPAVFDRLEEINTGVGKRRVEQVILTHTHFDHCAVLGEVNKRYSPVAYSFSPFEAAGKRLRDGMKLIVADTTAEVIHTPGHSHDSVCLYFEKEEILFAGDSPVVVLSKGFKYEEDFVSAMKRISRRPIKTIYFGHGAPMTQGAQEAIRRTLKNIS